MPRLKYEECVHEAYRRHRKKPLGLRGYIAVADIAVLCDVIDEICEDLGLDPLTAPKGKWFHIAQALPKNFRIAEGAGRMYYAWEIYFFYHESRGIPQTPRIYYPHSCYKSECKSVIAKY